MAVNATSIAKKAVTRTVAEIATKKMDKVINSKKKTQSQVGSFGKNLIFSVSSYKVLTFDNFQHKLSGRWNEHNVIGDKPRAEFLGPGLRTISLTIVLDSNMGVKPWAMLEKISYMITKGTVEKLVIGKKSMGKHRYRITEMSDTWDTIYANGSLAKATVKLTFEEYI